MQQQGTKFRNRNDKGFVFSQKNRKTFELLDKRGNTFPFLLHLEPFRKVQNIKIV
jgi:hypothetical protein